MKKTLSAYDLKKAFVEYNRNYYSFDGLKALLNYYDKIDENMELDVIAICSACTEYGNDAACTLQDLKNDYGYLYPVLQYLEDEGLSENEFSLTEYIESLVEVISKKNIVLYVSNGNYIVFY
jgi:hypothetical protein